MKGGHTGFSADPGRRRDSLYPPHFMNQWGKFYQTCMDTSMGQAKELIKFGDFDLIFKVTEGLSVCTISLEPMGGMSPNLHRYTIGTSLRDY